MQLLLNPRRRRRAVRSRKARSPAQRAATRKMLAANRARSAPRRASRRRRAVVHANPIVRRRSRRRSYRRNPIGGRARRYAARFSASGAMGLLKSGAMMGAGAVAGDILYGQLARFLPVSLSVPTNADGSTNWGYFAGKAATAIAIGTIGKKILPARFADAAAVGMLSVLAYAIIRAQVPASIGMGAYVNPARVMNPGRLSGMGAYQRLPGAMPAAAVPMAARGGFLRR